VTHARWHACSRTRTVTHVQWHKRTGDDTKQGASSGINTGINTGTNSGTNNGASSATKQEPAPLARNVSLQEHAVQARGVLSFQLPFCALSSLLSSPRRPRALSRQGIEEKRIRTKHDRLQALQCSQRDEWACEPKGRAMTSTITRNALQRIARKTIAGRSNAIYVACTQLEQREARKERCLNAVAWICDYAGNVSTGPCLIRRFGSGAVGRVRVDLLNSDQPAPFTCQ
jgi:hypothetical protein